MPITGVLYRVNASRIDFVGNEKQKVAGQWNNWFSWNTAFSDADDRPARERRRVVKRRRHDDNARRYRPVISSGTIDRNTLLTGLRDYRCARHRYKLYDNLYTFWTRRCWAIRVRYGSTSSDPKRRSDTTIFIVIFVFFVVSL